MIHWCPHWTSPVAPCRPLANSRSLLLAGERSLLLGLSSHCAINLLCCLQFGFLTPPAPPAVLGDLWASLSLTGGRPCLHQACARVPHRSLGSVRHHSHHFLKTLRKNIYFPCCAESLNTEELMGPGWRDHDRFNMTKIGACNTAGMKVRRTRRSIFRTGGGLRYLRRWQMRRIVLPSSWSLSGYKYLEKLWDVFFLLAQLEEWQGKQGTWTHLRRLSLLELHPSVNDPEMNHLLKVVP